MGRGGGASRTHTFGAIIGARLFPLTILFYTLFFFTLIYFTCHKGSYWGGHLNPIRVPIFNPIFPPFGRTFFAAFAGDIPGFVHRPHTVQ